MLKKLFAKLRKEEVKLEKANDAQKDIELYVARCISKYGAQELANASDRIKSDAKFILDLVKVYPDCLVACAPVLFDRYEVDGEKVEVPVNEMLFAALCCERNSECFKYIKSNVAKEYLKAVENGEMIEDENDDEFSDDYADDFFGEDDLDI